MDGPGLSDPEWHPQGGPTRPVTMCPPRPMFVPLTPIRCLHRAVDLFPNKIGVISGEKQFTYRQFGDRAERLATGLLAEGITKGDRVA